MMMDGQQQQQQQPPQRCLRHPRQRNMVGVCSSCLRERLNALAEYSRITDAYNPPPPPTQSTLNFSSSSTHHHQINNKHTNNHHHLHQQDHIRHSNGSIGSASKNTASAPRRPPSQAASEAPAPHSLHKRPDHHHHPHQSEQKQLPLQVTHTQASHSSSSSSNSSSSSSQKQRKSTGVNTTTTTTTSACSTSSGNGSRNTTATAAVPAAPATVMANSNSSSQRVVDIQEDQELQELQQHQYYHHHQNLKKPEVQRSNTQQPHEYYKKRNSNSKLKNKDADNAADLGVDDKMASPSAPELQRETQSCTAQITCEHPDQQGVQPEHENHDLHDAISSGDFKENMNIIINSDAGTTPHAKKKKKTSWFSLPTTSKSKSTEASTSHHQQHQAQTNPVSARPSSASIKSQPRAFVDRNGVLITSGRKSTGEAAIGSSLRQSQLVDLEAISEINHSQSTGPSSWISSLFHRKPKGRSKSMLDAAETASVMSAFASGLSVNQSPKVSIDAGRLSWDGARPNFRQILKKLEIRNHQNKQRALADQHYHASPVFDPHPHHHHNQVTIKAVIQDNQDDDYQHNHVIINKPIPDKLATHAAVAESPSQHQHPFTPPPLSKCKSVSSGRTSTLNPNLISSNHPNQGLLVAHEDINSATDSDDRNFPRSRSLGQRAWTRTLSPLLGLKQQYARKDR